MGEEAFLQEKRDHEKERRRQNKEASSAVAAATTAAAAAATAQPQPQPQPPPPLDFFGQLNKLAELRERSLLKEDEFNTAVGELAPPRTLTSTTSSSAQHVTTSSTLERSTTSTSTPPSPPPPTSSLRAQVYTGCKRRAVLVRGAFPQVCETAHGARGGVECRRTARGAAASSWQRHVLMCCGRVKGYCACLRALGVRVELWWVAS